MCLFILLLKGRRLVNISGLKSTRNKCEDQVFAPLCPVPSRNQSTGVTQGSKVAPRGKGAAAAHAQSEAASTCARARGKRHSKLFLVGRGRRQDASNGAEARKGQGRPRGLRMWELPSRGPEGLGRLLSFQAEASRTFSPRHPLESSVGISRPGAVRQPGRPSCCPRLATGRQEGGREGGGVARSRSPCPLAVRSRQNPENCLLAPRLRLPETRPESQPPAALDGCSIGKAPKRRQPGPASFPAR